MSKYFLSDESIKILSLNKFVKNVSNKAISYTDEFKVHFISEFNNGKSPYEIFEEAGFDINLIGGIKRIKNASYKWRRIIRERGIEGLINSKKNKSGRPITRQLSLEEQVKRKDAQIEYLQAEIELLKKLDKKERQVGIRRIKKSDIFGLIEIIIDKYKLKNMVTYLCESTGVSRSGYYNYINSEELLNLKEEKDLEIKEIILKAFNHKGYKKGSRSIKMVLERDYGIVFNRKRIQRIMCKYNIICPHRRINPYRKMFKATKEHRSVPNILKRNFKQGIPGKVLLTDITYLPYSSGKIAYLSTIKDGSTNEILSYHLSQRMTLDIAIKTIQNLMRRTDITISQGAFIHSDQGAHYTSPTYINLLKKHGLGQSMSRKGNCWDNAPQESFFGHMKDEINYKGCNSFEELKWVINRYMEYYNNHRYQWNLKKLTPVEYRNQLIAA